MDSRAGRQSRSGEHRAARSGEHRAARSGEHRAPRSGSRRAAVPVEGQAAQTLIVPGVSPGGQLVLSVLLKRTYAIRRSRKCSRAAADRPIQLADLHHGDAFVSSMAIESDVVAFKPATDVVLNGRVYAPDGAPVEALLASVSVGGYGKELLVIGDRVCHYQEGGDPVFEDPLPFTTIDLRYEHAYGGVDAVFDPTGVYAYPRNPVGRGFVVEPNEASIDGLALPNLEDPNDPLTPERLVVGAFEHWEQQPMPQGFGWFAKHWQPRILFAGRMPEPPSTEEPPPAAEDYGHDWDRTEEAPLDALPMMDFAFFNGASPGLVFPYLSGDELVETVNLSPEGDLSFRLPGDTPRIGLDVGQGVWQPPVVIQTVMMRMEDRELDIVWRAATAYASAAWLDGVKRFHVTVE